MSPPLEVVDVLVLLDDVYGALQSNPALVIVDEHHQAVGRADAHRPARVPRPPPRVALLEVPLEAARRLVVARAGFRSRRRTATLDRARGDDRAARLRADRRDLDRRSLAAARARGPHRPRARGGAEPSAALGARVRVLGARGEPDPGLRLAVLPRAHARPPPSPLVRHRCSSSRRELSSASSRRLPRRARSRRGTSAVPAPATGTGPTRSARSTRSGRRDSSSSRAARASSGCYDLPERVLPRAVLDAPAPVARRASALPDHALACARAA